MSFIALYKREKEELLKTHEETKIQRKALKRGKNLAISEDTCLKKERLRSKLIPRKVGVGLKRRRKPSKKTLGWRLAWRGSNEKKAPHLIELRKTAVLRTALQSNQSSLCGRHRSRDRGRGGPNGKIVSVKRAADGRRQRRRKITNENGEKYRAKNESLRNTSTDSKGATFVILINHASAPVRMKRLSPTGKTKREANQIEFMEKGGMPDIVKNFREIVSKKDRPRPQPGFVKPIRDGLRKIQNLF